MAILYIDGDPVIRSRVLKKTVLDLVFENIDEENEWSPAVVPKVWTADTYRFAKNYLLDVRGIDAVFIAYFLPDIGKHSLGMPSNTVDNGLVGDFLAAGFGCRHGKPLIACDPQRLGHLRRAGCNEATDWSRRSLEAIVRKIKGGIALPRAV